MGHFVMRTTLAATTSIAIAIAIPTLALSQDAGNYSPKNYQDLVRTKIAETFKDPGSIKDSYLSAPVFKSVMFSSGWLVCFRANAKNSYGGYTGRKDTAYFFNKGKITDGGEDTTFGICRNAKYFAWNPNIK